MINIPQLQRFFSHEFETKLISCQARKFSSHPTSPKANIMTQKPKMTHVRFALTPPPRHRDRSGLCTREMRPCFFSPVQFYRNCQLYVSLFVCLYACICVCTCVIMKYGVICTIVCSLSPRRRHLACVTTDEKNSGPRFVIRPLNLISYTLGADYCV